MLWTAPSMNMQNNTKPSLLNKICAHPFMISWVLGACALYAFLIGIILDEVPLRIIATDWITVLSLLIILIPASLLGFFVGLFMFIPLIIFVCKKLNGAPLKPGDQILILSGPHKGIITEVSAMAKGQGGWELSLIHI